MDALLTNLIVALCHQYENIESWQQESLTNELLSGGDTFSADVILQPVGRTHAVLLVRQMRTRRRMVDNAKGLTLHFFGVVVYR